ncbi:MAG: N(4)-(beta-N-acetylglucosaminyl)-L-asparaginase [Acidobacteria bacterium]|nr:N(4)-(beta-N-acetylglucosaminyl)-L-asparaginase [Acidobacteriota bacterium]
MANRRDFLKAAAIGLTALSVDGHSGEGSERFRRPVVVSTWDSGMSPNAAAWEVLSKGGRALDAVEKAGNRSEDEPSCCVGLAALPDRDGIVTLDACIMDENANIGSVSFLDRIKHPVSVARRVMERTPHVMLAGEGARQFAVSEGFELESGDLSPESEKAWKEWLKGSNYKPWQVSPGGKAGSTSQFAPAFFADGTPNHDTMGTIAMDAKGDLSGMVTTSGLAYKMHGRVGDSPIIGAGLFVDNKIGAATSSGVGEEVIRICGTHTVVEQMRFGRTPQAACAEAVRRIVERMGDSARSIQVGFVALSRSGEVGAYSVTPGFVYSVRNASVNKVFAAPSHFKQNHPA